jgi:hypothetical protein
MNTDSWIHNTKQEEAGGTRVEETKLSAHSHTHTHTHRGREKEREGTGVGWKVSVWSPLLISSNLGGRGLLEPQNHPLNVQLV